ncbi:MAG TPA: class I adenylate-forming enzyme family protein [Stellaceae bacterium]|nr:class I adenylate-forming enzyme family protein [Stellaceae bacterium]
MPLLTLLNAQTLAAYTAAGFWGKETIYRLAVRRAEEAPDAFALRARHRRLTYAEVVAAADRLAAQLAGHGVKAGDRVAVWLPSRVETAVALIACSRNAYVCCPSLHRDHRVAEIVTLVERVRAAALIAQPGYGIDGGQNDVFAGLAGREFLRLCWAAEPNDAPDAVPFAKMEKPAIRRPPSWDANQIMYLPFTSGTTGQPKGVLHSDNTLLATARMMVRDWRLEQAVLYTLSPLSHNLGLGALITAIAGGGELVLHDLPRGASLIDRLEETGAQFLFGVPTHALDLLGEMRARGIGRLSHVRGFRVSGAAAPPALVADLIEHGVTPQSGYGMTETCSHQYTRPDDPPEQVVGTCGRACDGYELRIWRQDDPDTEVPPGEIGEIGGRGASLMLGYYGDQSATDAAFNAHGWFMTGDLGWLDEAGYLHITGRKKDIIVRGGRNIYPAGIEALALRCEGIEKAAAFALPDARLGERVCLAVVVKPGVELDPHRLLADLAQHGLGKYEMPEFLLPVAAMPLTASGKIVKRELMRWVAEGEARPLPLRGG